MPGPAAVWQVAHVLGLQPEEITEAALTGLVAVCSRGRKACRPRWPLCAPVMVGAWQSEHAALEATDD